MLHLLVIIIMIFFYHLHYIIYAKISLIKISASVGISSLYFPLWYKCRIINVGSCISVSTIYKYRTICQVYVTYQNKIDKQLEQWTVQNNFFKKMIHSLFIINSSG